MGEEWYRVVGWGSHAVASFTHFGGSSAVHAIGLVVFRSAALVHEPTAWQDELLGGGGSFCPIANR